MLYSETDKHHGNSSDRTMHRPKKVEWVNEKFRIRYHIILRLVLLFYLFVS